MKVILSKGEVMLIDDCDAALILSLSWSWFTSKNTKYASCNTVPYRGQLVHRLILGVGKGVQVDHRNGNGLDNRRANLREATHSQNCCNARNRKDRSGLYRGVKFNKSDGRFHARISLDGNRKHLGSYSTAEGAAKAFDAVAKNRGEFARLNFPEGRAE